MAEALGLVASIIAVVQISGTVISICDNYQNALKKTAKDIERLREGVVSLKELLEELATLLRRENLPKAHFDAIQKKLTSSKILTACETELEGLEKKLRSRKGIKGIIRAFKQETTEAEVSMTILRIDGYKSTLTFALMIGQL
jgi:hypothetical protein